MTVINDPLKYDPIEIAKSLVRGKYDDIEESRAFCPNGEGGGVTNSCSNGGSPAATPSTTLAFHPSSEKLTVDELGKMARGEGQSGGDVESAMKLLKTPQRFELIGALTKSMPRDSVDAGDYAVSLVESVVPKDRGLPEKLSDQIAEVIQGFYGDSIQYGKENNIPRNDSIEEAALLTSCLTAELAAGISEHPTVLDASLGVIRRQAAFDKMKDGGLEAEKAARMASTASAMYDATEDSIYVIAENAFDYVNSVMGTAASRKDDTGKWETISGDVPFYSTSQLGHSIAHENGHRLHYQAIRRSLGMEVGTKLTDEEIGKLQEHIVARDEAFSKHIRENPGVALKMVMVSKYAQSLSAEFVAEYYTGLSIGSMNRDDDLDKLMDIMGFPVSELPKGKKGASKKK